MQSLFLQSFNTTKLAQETVDRVNAVVSSTTAAAARDALLQKSAGVKVAAGTELGDQKDSVQDADQEALTVEGIKEQVLKNTMKPGRLYSVGAVEGGPPAASSKTAAEKQALGEALALRSALAMVSDAKVAAHADELFAKVACVLCNVNGTEGCGFCGGTGCMTKSAAEEAIQHLDADSDLDTTFIAAKMAEDGAAMLTEKEAAAMEADVSANLNAMDSVSLDAQMHPSEPPPESFGSLNIRYHPLSNFLGKNF